MADICPNNIADAEQRKDFYHEWKSVPFATFLKNRIPPVEDMPSSRGVCSGLMGLPSQCSARSETLSGSWVRREPSDEGVEILLEWIRAEASEA